MSTRFIPITFPLLMNYLGTGFSKHFIAPVKGMKKLNSN